MHADAALSKRILDRVLPDSRLTGEANLLSCRTWTPPTSPSTRSRSSPARASRSARSCSAPRKPAHILTPTSTVRRHRQHDRARRRRRRQRGLSLAPHHRNERVNRTARNPTMSFTIVEQAPPRLNRSELAVPGSSPQLFEKAAQLRRRRDLPRPRGRGGARPEGAGAQEHHPGASTRSTGAPRPSRSASTASTPTTCTATWSTCWSRPATGST